MTFKQLHSCGHDFIFAKADNDKRLAFGWASVAVRVDGEVVVDWQDDIIDIEELERAAYEYVAVFGVAGEMHVRGGVGRLIESVVFTKEKAQAMGIPEGYMPEGWWIGFRVDDDEVWQKVKDGTYNMFSIEGKAKRVPVDATTQPTEQEVSVCQIS